MALCVTTHTPHRLDAMFIGITASSTLRTPTITRAVKSLTLAWLSISSLVFFIDYNTLGSRRCHQSTKSPYEPIEARAFRVVGGELSIQPLGWQIDNKSSFVLKMEVRTRPERRRSSNRQPLRLASERNTNDQISNRYGIYFMNEEKEYIQIQLKIDRVVICYWTNNHQSVLLFPIAGNTSMISTSSAGRPAD